MSDAGTSLESLETGNIENSADAERMAAILRDMNAAADDGEQREPMPSMVPRMPMPPSDMSRSSSSGGGFVEEPVASRGVQKPRKGNLFNTIFQKIREPLLVACLMFILSLPVFHMAAAKVVPWAFAIGGELSYLGLIVKSLFTGGLFAVIQMGLAFL